jgi:hypothetical protein
MKKIIMITVAVASVLFMTALIVNPVSAQTAKKSVGDNKPIPSAVMKIAEKSCVNCHTEPGNGMALMHVNLSNWDKYSPEKQADKAKAMCNMVTKDKMPPKKFRSTHPDGIPSKDEIKTICDWAESLQVPKK